MLIVIEGIDGSGKTTQIDLLIKYLAQNYIPYEVISFPQYGKNEYAEKIYLYLSGKFVEVNQYSIAKAYASDRKTARDLINSWLESGELVIANRYVSSSKAHLGANLPDEKREEFFKWLERLEYDQNGMPKENLTILLNVDPKKGQQNSQDPNKPDIHENDLNHLIKANEIYLELSKNEPNWVVVNCMENGQMKSAKKIHQEIIEIVFANIPS